MAHASYLRRRGFARKSGQLILIWLGNNSACVCHIRKYEREIRSSATFPATCAGRPNRASRTAEGAEKRRFGGKGESRSQISAVINRVGEFHRDLICDIMRDKGQIRSESAPVYISEWVRLRNTGYGPTPTTCDGGLGYFESNNAPTSRDGQRVGTYEWRFDATFDGQPHSCFQRGCIVWGGRTHAEIRTTPL